MKKELIEKILKYSGITLIGVIIILLSIFLFFPKASMSMYKHATYGTIQDADSSFKKADLKIVNNKDLSDIKVGEVIVFKYIDESDEKNSGIRAYKVHSPYNDGTLKVKGNGGIALLYIVDEDNYLGNVVSKIPLVGAVTGFIASWWGIFTVSFNIIAIGLLIFLVKYDKEKKDKKTLTIDDEEKVSE